MKVQCPTQIKSDQFGTLINFVGLGMAHVSPGEFGFRNLILESTDLIEENVIQQRGLLTSIKGGNRTVRLYVVELLLMEKILHQLIGSLSHYLQGFIHPRWCRISSINSYGTF